MDVLDILQSTRCENSVPGDESYNAYGSYLCQEVFTDMSVLPLVFPSSFSCFSLGSYKEELARRRELPVPPLPKRGGVLARSEDNITVLGFHPLSKVSPSSTTPAIRTRHSSFTWLQQERGEMMETRIGRKNQDEDQTLERIGGGRTVDQECERELLHVKSVTNELQYNIGDQNMSQCDSVTAMSSESALFPYSEIEQQVSNIVSLTEHSLFKAGEERAQVASDVLSRDGSTVCCEAEREDTENSEAESDVENSVTEKSLSKMSMFKKTEKSSLFRSAINRLSLRSKKKNKNSNDGNNKKDTDSEDIKKAENSKGKQATAHENLFESKPVVTSETDRKPNEQPKVATNPPLPISLPPVPSSATFSASRPISQLDSALKSFKLATAKSRENLLLPRSDIHQVITQSSDQHRMARAVNRNCPPTPSTRWRQKPPPTNSYVDSEWKKLSASMINLNQSKRNLSGKETDLSKTEVALRSSNMSLDTGSFSMGMEKVLIEEVRVTRAQSMNVLDVSGGERKIQIPCNQLMEMNPYQRRVQASMEKLSVPSWYNPPDTPSPSPSTPHISRWRQAGGSSSAGWRRHVSHSASSTTSTLERNPTHLSSQRYKARFSTLPSSTRSPSNSSINSSTSTLSSTPSKQVYLGWRSQERLDIGPAYLTSPAQRLASSAIPCSVQSVSAIAATDTAKEGIKDITDAILDFCNSPIGPPQVKEAWPHIEDDSDDSDNLDDDSGIDRSDDFTQEILNED